MARTRLDKYIEYISGYADSETTEEIRKQLEDPESEASRFFRGMRESLQDPFGLGHPLFAPGEVCEEFPEPDEASTGLHGKLAVGAYDAGDTAPPGEPEVGHSAFGPSPDPGISWLFPATFGDDVSETLTATDKPVRWKVKLQLRQAEWLSREDAGEVTRLEFGEILVEFSWRPLALEVRLGGALGLGFPQEQCQAGLVDAVGKTIAVSEARDRKITFTLVDATTLQAVDLECNCRRPGVYHLRFRVPLRPVVRQ